MAVPLVAFALAVPGGGDEATPQHKVEVHPSLVGEHDWRLPGASSPATEASTDAAALPFARIGGVEVLTPTPAPLIVGFHQANGPGPLDMTPVGEHVADHDAAVGAWDGVASTGYTILPSRVRGTSDTSAVDIAMRPDEPVLAVTDGVVVDASTYSLYGSTRDVIIAIRPDADPSLLVKVLHVNDAAVAPGDRVVAGETVISSGARVLPFGSQVDRFTGDRFPHAHIEVIRG